MRNSRSPQGLTVTVACEQRRQLVQFIEITLLYNTLGSRIGEPKPKPSKSETCNENYVCLDLVCYEVPMVIKMLQYFLFIYTTPIAGKGNILQRRIFFLLTLTSMEEQYTQQIINKVIRFFISLRAFFMLSKVTRKFFIRAIADFFYHQALFLDCMFNKQKMA